MPTKFYSSNMTSNLQPFQPRHITLDLADMKPSHEMTDLTAENDHNTEPYPPDDIDFIDGRVPRVPKAIPETDEDDDDDDRPISTAPGTGIDDGLLPNGGHDVYPVKPPSRRPSFGFPSYNGTGFVEINGVETPIPDLNAYQHKKTLAQGMMDLALLSANANQLRYVLESAGHPYYYPSLIFISISIIFQFRYFTIWLFFTDIFSIFIKNIKFEENVVYVILAVAVGVGLILNSKYNIKNDQDICRANRVNNYTVIGIFIVTVVNVFISAFGVVDTTPGTI